MMGPKFVLAGFVAAVAQNVLAMELAPISYIPPELVHLLHPGEVLDDFEHDGFVERSRRAIAGGKHATGSSGRENIREGVATYTLENLGGAPCIKAQTDCLFQLEYQTLRYGMRTVQLELPPEPDVSGSCVREGDTAVLTMRWSVFNFSLVFTSNPEGNSYYLNKAILRYNQSLETFADATYRGPVILQTQKKSNFYFTPLGHSYVCRHGEDQGPLDLFNVDDERVGNMTLYNTRFQPFWKRAKGEWGQDDHCLPKAIQIMREDVVPFVTSGAFFSFVLLLIGGYGLYRKFFVKATDFDVYDAGADIGGGGEIIEEELEMTATTNGTTNGSAAAKQPPPPPEAEAAEQYVHADPKPKPAANPFTKGQASNPFTGAGV